MRGITSNLRHPPPISESDHELTAKDSGGRHPKSDFGEPKKRNSWPMQLKSRIRRDRLVNIVLDEKTLANRGVPHSRNQFV